MLKELMNVDTATPWVAGCNQNEMNKLLFSNLWNKGQEMIVNENPTVSLLEDLYLNI